MKIKSVVAREVLDSRGNPTVEADLSTGDINVSAMVPSGASTGFHEALELRDGELDRYLGKGVRKAVDNVNKIIAPKVVGLDCKDQLELDNVMLELDGTDKKKKLGANAILAVSMAACKAGAVASKIPLYEYIAKLAGKKGVTLPVPQLNVINGGRHAGRENDIQENMLLPIGAISFAEGIRMGTETYHMLKKMLVERFGASARLLGDEGGFVPPFDTPQDRLDFMVDAIDKAGYSGKIAIALDPAASEFYYEDENVYRIGETAYDSSQLVDFYKELVSAYPIVSIEDGMAEDDWEGWTLITKDLGGKIQITGDDLLVTNVERIEKAIELEAVNALLLKVNQIGSVSESVDAANMSFKEGWSVTVSHRSGETEDSFIADLCVGLDCGQLKSGAPARSERLAKYNRLIRIEEQLGGKARYPGSDFRGPH